jgi:hypothetical protein
MSEMKDVDKARARQLVHAMDARWGWGSQPALGWRSVWHSPPGGVFGVWMVLVDDDRATARLWGWDRDLSDLVPTQPVPLRQVGGLVAAVAAVVDDLMPAYVPAAAPAVAADRPVRPIPPTSPLSTAAALEAREHGYVGQPLLTDDGLRSMLARRWPGVAITEVPGPDRQMSYRLRPYGSSQVVFGGKVDRGRISAGPLVGSHTFGIPGRHPAERADERGARRLIDAVDDWLTQTMPPARVLDRPVVQGYDDVRSGAP